jgi:hypothetical protein
MNITKAIVQLRGQLVKDINRAGLPPVVVGLVLDGIRHEIEKLTAEDMRKEDTEHADTDATEHAE